MALLLALGLVSCSGPGSPPGVVTMALDAAPTNLDPRFALDANSSRLAQLLFNGLVRYDERSQIAADLALRWEHPAPTTYIFYLRRGVRFHDGRELTAADVEYTYRSLLSAELGSPKRGSYRELQDVQAVERYTVRFTLRKFQAPFLGNLTLGIVPKHVAEGKPAGVVHRRPVGSGPFRFVRWRSDDRLELEANPEYFAGPPKLAGLHFRVIPEQTVSVLELESGGIDLIQNDVAPDLLPRLRRNPRLKIVTAPGTNIAYVGFNLTDPILRHPKVRRAIAHAIDRRSIISYLLRGLAETTSTLLSPTNWAYAAGLPSYAYDPERARALLDAAGFPDPDGPGPRPRFRLSYKTTKNDLRQRIALVLQEELAAVGVQLDVRFYEWGTFFSDITKGNFQLYTLAWVGIRDPDIYYYTMHSGSIPPAGANRGRYRNQRLDALLEQGRSARTLAARRAIYHEVQRLVAAELPYVHLWHTTNVAVMRREIEGFRLYPAGDLLSLKEVTISPG